MIEIITIDDKQFELTTEYPLTVQQKSQIIEDMRNRLRCDTCKDATSNLGEGIQSLTVACVDIIVQAPTTIAITTITVGTDTCTIGGTCPNNIICPDANCSPITRDITVTFENSGDIPGDIVPTLTVDGTTTTGTLATVPARSGGINGTIDIMFTGITLIRGSNHICADWT